MGSSPTARDRNSAATRIHIDRDRVLCDRLHERIRISNFGTRPVHLDLGLDCWADFRDIFEVRGVAALQRGRVLPPAALTDGFLFGYESVDGRWLRTRIVFDREVRLHGSRAHVPLTIGPGETEELNCTISVDQGEDGAPGEDAFLPASAAAHLSAWKESERRVADRVSLLKKIETSRPNFDAWLARSAADLAMLTVDLETGPYPHAGVPWFSAPFGRDALITALQTLWLDPRLAEGVLGFLADRQAKTEDPFRESTPGKILHEERRGEMSRTGQVPFARYYGGIDQTLLFVMLAGAHYRRTGDLDFLRRMAPHARAALRWAATHGDPDGDGFIEYARTSDRGLRNQGWKDSDDALFHADGQLCQGPIALVEVQAYHVAALRAGADIVDAIEGGGAGAPLRQQAEALVARIDAVFWDEALGGYAIALDGEKAPVRVLGSNAGHVLFAGAALPARVAPLARTLGDSHIATSYGLRTVARGAARYNPMGYHNGTIWPHDNAIIAAGLAANGFGAEAARITTALFDASTHFPLRRLPELWCGLDRADGASPVSYPSACAPQAWAAASPYMCLQACLGLRIDAVQGEVQVRQPRLPAGITDLTLRDLRIGANSLTLRFVRSEGDLAQMLVQRAPDGIRFSFKI